MAPGHKRAGRRHPLALTLLLIGGAGLDACVSVSDSAPGNAGAAAGRPGALGEAAPAWEAEVREALVGGAPDAALMRLRAARDAQPDHVELLFWFGECYRQKGADGPAYLALAEYLQDADARRHRPAAERALQDVQQRASGALVQLLRSMVRRDEVHDATRLIQVVRRFDERHPVMQGDFRQEACQHLSVLAAGALEAREREDALRFATDALAFTRQCPLAYAVAARSLRIAGDHDAAANWLRQGLEENPEVHAFHRDLAEVYADEGDFARAGAHLRDYLRAEDDGEERREASARLQDMERRARFRERVSQATGHEDLPRSSGTAFVVSDAGHALTAAHVVEGTRTLRVITDKGDVRSAEVLWSDPEKDVALLKVAGELPALPLATHAPALGAEVFTIGFPDILVLGLSPKLASGVVSSSAGPLDAPHLLQISVPIQPGNSGGPLIDARGEVVGVVVGRMMPGAYENVAYAISSAHVRELLRSPLPAGTLPAGDDADHALRGAGRPRARGRATPESVRGSVLLVLAW